MLVASLFSVSSSSLAAEVTMWTTLRGCATTGDDSMQRSAALGVFGDAAAAGVQHEQAATAMQPAMSDFVDSPTRDSAPPRVGGLQRMRLLNRVGVLASVQGKSDKPKVGLMAK